jgi:hypothetical protein
MAHTDNSQVGASVGGAGGAVPGESQTPASERPTCKLWGMVTRLPRWGLSWRGRLLILPAILVLGSLLVLRIHAFLAVIHRVDANILVVEGWIDNYAIRGGASEFKKSSYERVFTTGGPFNGRAYGRRTFQQLLKTVALDAIVETGAFLRTITEFLTTTRLPVSTLEINPRNDSYTAARVRFERNRFGCNPDNSPNFLRCVANNPTFSPAKTFSDLNAH